MDLTLSPAEHGILPEDVPVPESPGPFQELYSPSEPSPAASGLPAAVLTSPGGPDVPFVPPPSTTVVQGPLPLDPAVAQLYEPARLGEDFLQSRRRIDRQETLSFQPLRQPVHQRPEPYMIDLMLLPAAILLRLGPLLIPMKLCLVRCSPSMTWILPNCLMVGRSVVMDISTW